MKTVGPALKLNRILKIPLQIGYLEPKVLGRETCPRLPITGSKNPQEGLALSCNGCEGQKSIRVLNYQSA